MTRGAAGRKAASAVGAGLLVACVPVSEPGGQTASSCATDDLPTLVVSTTDYSVGALATIDADGVVTDSLTPTSGDPLVFAQDGVVLQVNRGSANSIRLYDPGCWSAPRLEIGVETGANVHDVALVGSELFATLYERDYLAVYDADTGLELATIDLSDHTDPDGLPEAAAIVELDGQLYVALQQLDRTQGWVGAGGRIVQVDPSLREVVAWWDVGVNPKLFAHPWDPDALVVLSGLSYHLDGALQRLDLATGTVASLPILESDLGYDLMEYAEVDGVGVIVGVDLDGASHVQCLDWATGDVVQGPSASSWLAWATPGSDGSVWMAARSGWTDPLTGHGVFALDVATCTERGPWVQLALQPYNLAWLP